MHNVDVKDISSANIAFMHIKNQLTDSLGKGIVCKEKGSHIVVMLAGG